MVVRRTESDRTANGIRLDGVRNLIGRRTESDWAADANGRKPMIYNIILLSGKTNNVVINGLKAQQSHSPGQRPG